MKSRYIYRCYNIGTGTAMYTELIDVTVYAYGEEQALNKTKERVKRDIYELREVLI